MTRPRIRTLKPETWQDEKVGQLSRDARLLFVGLITMADDSGRLRAMPLAILGHVFPYDSDAPKKLDRWLAEIESVGLVHFYEVDGTRYGWLSGWSKHQRVNRVTPSELPDPDGTYETPAAEEKDGFRKQAIPERVRREVARAAGAEPGDTTDAQCHYCGAPGAIRWPRLASGKPGSWVTFSGLELDHVEAESNGGEATAENIVLACTRCNRSKGHGTVTEFRDRAERKTVEART